MIAGSNPNSTVLESTGPPIEDERVRIFDPDPLTGEGEIQVKGENVMKGYFKEPELTKRVFTEDGWFKTGDLGVFDKYGNLYIKGRLKNMILGASGENIYPEEIESIINNFQFVIESIVVEQKGKLIALVHYDREKIKESYKHAKEDITEFVDNHIKELSKELRTYVNARVNNFSKIHNVLEQANEFQKTATHKIKRYLYKETDKK